MSICADLTDHSLCPDPEFSRVYIENGGWDYPQVLRSSIGMLYPIQLYML